MGDASEEPGELDALVAEIGRRLDRSQATTAEFIDWAFAKHPVISVIVAALGGEPSLNLLKDHRRFREDLRSLADSALSVSRHGWAMSKYTPVTACRQVVELKRSGGNDADIDDVLTRAWNESGVFDTLPARVGVLGAEDDELWAIASGRRRLVERAIVHHREGSFEASIPILLAQIEGICRDATTTADCEQGLGFFTKRFDSRDAVIDDHTVAGMECGLTAVRAWFSTDTPTSGLLNLGSRHGVLHGRDVAYDTHVMSTKCLALLVAVWEWASRRLGEIAAERHQARYDQHAGLDGVDHHGWRLDRRGFSEARSSLTSIGIAQQLHFREHRHYVGLWQLVVRPDANIPVAAVQAVEMITTRDGWRASLRTEAGWVFSIGGYGDTTSFADGPATPATIPPSSEWRAEPDGNWSSDCHW